MEIELKILPDKNYHKDLFIRIGEEEEYADTYYFWKDEFSDLEKPYNALFERISKYLSIWIRELKLLPIGKDVFMPIDFSDEYVGGFKVKSLEDSFDIVYGYIYDISNIVVQINDDHVYTNLDEKNVDLLINVKMGKEQFLKSLKLLPQNSERT